MVGGDTSSSERGLFICPTVIGEADEEQITYRNTAKPNDLILVSGDFGAAYMGLQILEREKAELAIITEFLPNSLMASSKGSEVLLRLARMANLIISRKLSVSSKIC